MRLPVQLAPSISAVLAWRQASAACPCCKANFFLRLGDGSMMSNVWSSFLDPAAYQGRTELLRYDSPAIHGFIFSASISESSGGLIGGNNYGAMLRYAGEHNGFRIAAGVGFEHIGDVYTNQSTVFGTTATAVTLPGLNLVPNACTTGNVAATATAGANAQSLTCKTPDVNAWGVGLSAMHIHTGLFLQGAIEGVEYNNAGSATSAYWGETCGSATAGGTLSGLSQQLAVAAIPRPTLGGGSCRAVSPRTGPAGATLCSMVSTASSTTSVRRSAVETSPAGRPHRQTALPRCRT